MQVLRIWLLVVFSAQADHAFISDECNWACLRIGANLSHHYIDSKVELFTIEKERIWQVFLKDVALCKCVARNAFEVLDKKDAATLSTCMRFNNVSLPFLARHVTLTRICLQSQVKCQRHEIEVMFEVSLHSLEYLSKSGFVCGTASPWQSIVDRRSWHYSLVVCRWII